jgi:hypothetical protein
MFFWPNGFSHKEAEGAVFEDGTIPLRLFVHAVFMVAEDYDAGFGSNRITNLVVLDDKHTHGRECLSNTPRTMQLEVPFLGYLVVDIQ